MRAQGANLRVWYVRRPNVPGLPVVMMFKTAGWRPIERRTDIGMAAWEQGLDALVRTRGSALVGYAYLLCGDRREAEDLVQDALVKTFSRGRNGPEAASLEGYVRRAVLNTYLDGFRRRRRWAAVRHLVSPDDVGSSPDAGVVARLDVAAALTALSPRERACVVLRFYEDMTVARIAEELTLSQGTVKRYLSDGVHRLEGALGEMPAARAAADDRDGGDRTEDIELTIDRRRS